MSTSTPAPATTAVATPVLQGPALETINGIPVARPAEVVATEGETPVKYVVGFLVVMGGLGAITVGFGIFLMVVNNWNLLNWME